MKNVTNAKYSGNSILGIIKEYPALKVKAYDCGDFDAMDIILDIDIERDRTEISKLIGAGEYDDVIVTDETE